MAVPVSGQWYFGELVVTVKDLPTHVGPGGIIVSQCVVKKEKWVGTAPCFPQLLWVMRNGAKPGNAENADAPSATSRHPEDEHPAPIRDMGLTLAQMHGTLGGETDLGLTLTAC